MDGSDGVVEETREALRSVADPELGIDAVHLGLVYRVEAAGGRARVATTLTTPACPLARP